MRPITKAMMCAFFAVGVTAPALAAQSNYFIKLEGVDPPGASAPRDKEKWIEIQSWQWGATRAGDGKADALTDGLMIVRNSAGKEDNASTGGVRVASGDVDGDGRADVGATEKLTVGGGRTEAGKKPTSSQRMLVPGASKPTRGTTIGKAIGTAVTDGDEASSGALAEKRQHGWVTVSKPLDRGAVRVKIKFPWVGCRVGARYPTLVLGGGAQGYELRDAVVTSCGSASAGGGDGIPTEEVSFNYGKVVVRGWDPAKKEE